MRVRFPSPAPDSLKSLFVKLSATLYFPLVFKVALNGAHFPMNTFSYLKLSRHNVYIFSRRIPLSLRGFFKTNELRISTKVRDQKLALHFSRSITNESDLLFENLKNNMTDKNDLSSLDVGMKHWQEETIYSLRMLNCRTCVTKR